MATSKIKTETLPRTWSDIMNSFDVGETRRFPTVNPATLQSARVAISRRQKTNPDDKFNTQSFDGYFTITRIQ